MMNGLALSLILTTLVTAGVFSPPAVNKENQKDKNVIVKEGHRTVVVEYENDDKSNTRVVISPQEDQQGKETIISHDDYNNDKEKIKDGHWASPRELVCDAYGKCKHKIATALGRTKDKVSGKFEEGEEKIQDVEQVVKENVQEAYDKVKEKVKHGAEEISGKAKETKETIKGRAKEISGKAKGTKEAIKEGAKEITGKAKDTKDAIQEGAKEKAKKIKQSAEELVDTGRTLKGDVQENVSEKTHEAEQVAVQNGKKDLKEILGRGREVLGDAFSYVFSQESMAAAFGIVQLLGLSTCFGMSVWITFISSYVLAKALPRQQFAMVQSKIYPVYFKAMALSIGAVLIGHLLSHGKRLFSGGPAYIFQSFNLLFSLGMVLVNLYILEPRATKVMFERMRVEKEEGRDKESSGTATAETSARLVDSFTEEAITRATATPRSATTSGATTTATGTEERPRDARSRAELIRLSRKLKKLNIVSSFLNILTLMVLTWQLVHLGHSLHTVLSQF